MKPAISLALGLASSLALAVPPLQAQDATRTLSVSTWTGAYLEAQKRAVFDPFQTETNITIDATSHAGAIAKSDLDAKPHWDVIDLTSLAADELCRAGVLESIDPAKLAPGPDGKDVESDFLPGALRPCAVASAAWSAAIVFDGRAFEKAKPASASDFLDLSRFPGKRALPKGPRYTLEVALLADGVAPADVYAQLRTDEGVERAFKALDRIRPNIVWWQEASEPLQSLSDREAVMGLTFTGRTFRTAVTGALPFGTIWNTQIYDLDLWAIPKSSGNKDSALAFIAYATHPDRMAAQARLLPYGPMRRSAIDQVSQHAELDIDMKRFLPTAEGRLDKGLAYDGAFWAEREAALTTRFDAWLAAGTAPEPAAAPPAAETPPPPPVAETKPAPSPPPPAAETTPSPSPEINPAPPPAAAEVKPAPAPAVAAETKPAASPPPTIAEPAPPPVAAEQAPPPPTPAPSRTPPAQAEVTPPLVPDTSHAPAASAPRPATPDPARPTGRAPAPPSDTPASTSSETPDKKADAGATPPLPIPHPKKPRPPDKSRP